MVPASVIQAAPPWDPSTWRSIGTF